jgi:hypothetical protein
VAAAVPSALVIPTTASALPNTESSAAAPASSATEQAQLQALYQKAEHEGGKVTVYVGGDAQGQWDGIAQTFEAQYPGTKLHLVTDLSKHLDTRVGDQIATHDLVADVTMLQTTGGPLEPVPSISSSRASSDEGVFDWEIAVTAIPEAGPVELHYQWLDFGIAESMAEIDGEAPRDAADRSVELWPADHT